MEARQQDALLGGAAAHVHHGVEQVGPALAALQSHTPQSGGIQHSTFITQLVKPASIFKIKYRYQISASFLRKNKNMSGGMIETTNSLVLHSFNI